MEQIEMKYRAVSFLTEDLMERFIDYHEKNPQIYDELRRMALKLKRSGRAKFGVKALVEVLRYRNDIRADADDFKINNNYPSLYARLLMDNEPELAGFFEVRSGKHCDTILTL